MSKFYGIGVGPGNPELLTIKAVNILKTVDVILVPTAKKGLESLALRIAKPYIKEGIRIEERTFPMVVDLEVKEKAWDSISSEIETWVKEGLRVAFLTLGDTMTYATYIYLLERLMGRIEIETVPGITSYQGVASSTNTPLVVDDMSMCVVSCNIPLEEIRRRVRTEDSLVLMKLSLQFKEIIAMLIEEGVAPFTRLVSHATQEEEVVYEDLSTITDERISYFSTIVINKRWTS
ncbi:MULTISPECIES: precorrin-2 C(20)-methyltransferase [unclassified Fusibacter]|uniref:precorrin-2 C(20)-methyltransferase n=1 Tax=unclassified Fusibacter TaxID=2624464 RepID=UPI00101145CF|nr:MULTISPECIES: precorrin-2 C(20)-methyltransferase [unclassified Fusibacter]MCK8060509.1 precorrin-2 C(20)-methyltransferase [Fusibacter sp. A2]NPE20202.1 precorrin-2 C(20)-methyltransferase [Fusibacter sp. A1]RXV63411.1 precorrin-2 C(20)-methyltransferase [Fusibacter sp. A1]